MLGELLEIRISIHWHLLCTTPYFKHLIYHSLFVSLYIHGLDTLL